MSAATKLLLAGNLAVAAVLLAGSVPGQEMQQIVTPDGKTIMVPSTGAPEVLERMHSGSGPPMATPQPGKPAEQGEAKKDESGEKEKAKEEKKEGDQDKEKEKEEGKKDEKKAEGAPEPVKRESAPPEPPNPEELKVRPDEQGKVQFSFVGQKWLDVLQWLALISKMSLDWQELPGDYLNLESKHITDLQTKQPGRLVQTLEQASSQMFERLPSARRVDYYVKGPVVGLVLDAHIRRLTNGRKSMDDVMRLAYRRWSGARGYTGAEFNQTVSDAAGVDVGALLHKLIGTTEEVDYTEMLDWFGLRFAGGDDPAKAWALAMRPDATAAQKAHFAAFMAHSKR